MDDRVRYASQCEYSWCFRALLMSSFLLYFTCLLGMPITFVFSHGVAFGVVSSCSERRVPNLADSMADAIADVTQQTAALRARSATLQQQIYALCSRLNRPPPVQIEALLDKLKVGFKSNQMYWSTNSSTVKRQNHVESQLSKRLSRPVGEQKRPCNAQQLESA